MSLFGRELSPEVAGLSAAVKAVTMAVEGVVDVASQVTGFPKPQV